MTTKQSLAIFLQLPVDADWEDIEDHIKILRKLESGVRSIEEQGSISLNEVEKRLTSIVERKFRAGSTS